MEAHKPSKKNRSSGYAKLLGIGILTIGVITILDKVTEGNCYGLK